MDISVRRDWFAGLALAYLLIPSLIFLLTWIQPWFGIPVFLVVVAAFFLWWRQSGDAGAQRPKLFFGSLMMVFLLALGWTFLAGAGGVVPQESDYQKHNLIFHDLVHNPWPVKYFSAAGENYLCYGLGYYLVPTFCAKVVGESILPIATLTWAFFGVALFFYWLATLNQSPKKTLFIVLCFAATEALWHGFLHCLKHPFFSDTGPAISDSLVQLGLSAGYSDSFIALQFRPQHVISGWLGAALFYDMFWIRRNPRGAGLVLAACWLWSPLMCFGLLIIPLAALNRWHWRDVVEPMNLVGGFLLAVTTIYFQGHVPLTENGPIWKFPSAISWPLVYGFFVLFQLSPLLFLYLADRKYQLLGEDRSLFFCATAMLMLSPFYKVGLYGDLRLQAATPALLMVALAASRCLQSEGFSLKRPLLALLVASQLVGAAYPVGKFWWRSFTRGHADYSYAASAEAGIHNVSELKIGGYDFGSQYFGRTNSLAARWLLKK